MKPYRLSRRAKADLDDIWAYSELRWGVEQAADYARDGGHADLAGRLSG